MFDINGFIGFTLPYNGQNGALFVKIGARVLDLWLETFFGPKFQL